MKATVQNEYGTASVLRVERDLSVTHTFRRAELNRDYDFPTSTTLDHVPHRVCGFAQRIGRVDDWSELTRLD